jgi:quercetin dioxygenase-like cupin family protein
VIVALVEVPAGIKIGRHTHPGTVGASVLEGGYTILADGQPEKRYNVGEYLVVPAGTVHDEWPGDKPAKLMAVYVVEKGKPIASPVQ